MPPGELCLTRRNKIKKLNLNFPGKQAEMSQFDDKN